MMYWRFLRNPIYDGEHGIPAINTLRQNEIPAINTLRQNEFIPPLNLLFI